MGDQTAAGGVPGSGTWNYTPPATGVTAPYNPNAGSALTAAFDLKGPLSKFALGMAQQSLARQANPIVTGMPPITGMRIPVTPIQSPYSTSVYVPTPLGRLNRA